MRRWLLGLPLALTAAGCGCRPGGAPAAQGYLDGGDGVPIFYQSVGRPSRDTLVVVHGGPGAGSNDIRPDLESLQLDRVLIYYDQRGGGRSGLPPDTALLAPRYFVSDLEAVRTHFRLQRMILLAHSFGAIIAAEYARTYPNRVAAMVFLAATGPSRAEAARFYQGSAAPADTAAARLQAAVLDSLLQGTAADPVATCRRYEAVSRRLGAAAGAFTNLKSSTCDMPPAAIRYYYQYTAQLVPQAFGDWDFTRDLGQLAAPLLVVDGARDSTGLAMERAWTRAVPHGRLFLVPDAGRTAYAERPSATAAGIVRFLEGQWPDTTSVR